MEALHLQTNHLNDLAGALREHPGSGQDPISIGLSFLEGKGFKTPRFYERVRDYVAKRDYFVLSQLAPGGARTDCLGAVLDYDRSRFARIEPNGLPLKLSREEAANTTPEVLDIMRCLQVQDLHVLHIGLSLADVSIGQIVASWDGDYARLSESDLHSLRVVGLLISQALQAQVRHQRNVVLEKVRRAIQHGSPSQGIEGLLDALCSSVREALGARIAAVFSYDWYSDTLTKVSEKHETGLVSDTYFEKSITRGTTVTGSAFSQAIASVVLRSTLDDPRYRELVNPQSAERHERLLGKANALLFRSFGSTERPLLLRLIGRETDSKHVFGQRHCATVDRICRDIEEVIGNQVTTRRLLCMQASAAAAINNVNDLNSLINIITSDIQHDQVLGVLAMLFDVQSVQPAICELSLAGASASPNRFDIDSAFLADLKNCKNSETIAIEGHPEAQAAGSCLRFLRERGVRHLLPFRFPLRNGWAIVAFLLDDVRQSSKLLYRLPEKQKSALESYAGLISNCMRAAETTISADNARRLIGHIGHEISNPVAELGEGAIEAIAEAMDVADALKDKLGNAEHQRLIRQWDAKIADINKKMSNVAINMDIAMDMAQETNGRIEVAFEPFDLSSLVYRISDQVASEVGLYFRPTDKCEFVFNDAALNYKSFVGDPRLIGKVFLNILRNALKYSNPPGGGRSIRISIHGNPQPGLAIFLVKNWGVPVPEGKKELIFRAFERGEQLDRLRAKRGMGLGLYIARRFAMVHKGTVICRSSVPTLIDPARRQREGFETTFEARLATNLPVGTYEVQL